MISSYASSVDPLNIFLKVQPEVQTALDAGKPVVALESTIVAHGMPFPENLELAQEVENILRRKVNPNSIPALSFHTHRNDTIHLSPFLFLFHIL